MAPWHRHAWIAYGAVFLSVLGHASSEFVAVLCGIAGPELSVWRFLLGSAGLVRPVTGTYGALRVTTLTLAIGAVGLWFLVGLVWGIWVDPLTLPDRPPEQSGPLLTLALWTTTVTQFLWIGGLAAVPDITGGSDPFFLEPVIAALLAVAFLGEVVTGLQWFAIAVVCSSVAIEAGWAWMRGSRPVTRG